MTSWVSPRVERPAVRAKGTVRPSERPRVASARRREWAFVFGFGEGFCWGFSLVGGRVVDVDEVESCECRYGEL